MKIASQKIEESCSFSSPITHSSIRWKTRGGSGKTLGQVFTGTQWSVTKQRPLHLGWGRTSSIPTQRPSPQPWPQCTGTVLRSWAGDKRLLPLLQGSARSELLISTTHQHSCCSLQITYRILSIRLPKDKGPYVSWPDKSCGKLEEGGEITLNIA